MGAALDAGVAFWKPAGIADFTCIHWPCLQVSLRRIELERVAADRHQGTSSPPSGIGSTASASVRPAPASTPAPGPDDRED
jgi:hypothetical protein